MRLDTRDKFWIVTDPTSDSELVDIVFDCTLERLELQFLGGLRCNKDNPVLFTDEKEAQAEALRRMRQRDLIPTTNAEIDRILKQKG